MRETAYNVIAWGPGQVGSACIKSMLNRDDFELVGVRAHSAEKNGKDVGELSGLEPIVFKATTDKQTLLDMDTDVVLWSSALPTDMENDVIEILEGGKNIISTAGFHFTHSHDEAYIKKFEDACKKGNSSLHGTGENPGFWLERTALALTGICQEIEHWHLHEYADGSSQSKELMEVQSYNADPSTASVFGPRAKGDLTDFRIDKGNVDAQSHSFTGIMDGKPHMTITLNRYSGIENTPYPLKDTHYWATELEGKPVSLRCEISAFTLLTNNLYFRPNDRINATWSATAMLVAQAIPTVSAHDPRFAYPSIFTHSSTNFRRLHDHSSLAG